MSMVEVRHALEFSHGQDPDQTLSLGHSPCYASVISTAWFGNFLSNVVGPPLRDRESSVSFLRPADASNVMMLLPSVLRPHRFPCVLPLVALSVTTVFFTLATGALAQERYRSPDKAVAALVDAMRSEALQRVMRVLGPGSDEIVSSGDPVDDE